MKRIISVILALTMMFAVCSLNASAEEAGEEMVTVTMMVSEASSQPYLQDTAPLRYIKENFGIDIQFQAVPESDFSTKIATVFATNDLPDLVLCSGMDQIGTYELEDMLVNLLEYKDLMPNFFSLVDADDRIAAQKTQWQVNSEGEDALYCMYRLEYNRIDIAPIGAIRGDLMEELNLEMPTTWDELYDIMLKIKAAYPDVYFFSSRNGTNYMLGGLAYAMGSGGFGTFDKERGMYYEPEQSKWLYGPTQDAFKSVVEYVAKAYADGLVDPDYATTTRDNLWEKISSGKVVYFKDNNSFISSVFQPAFDNAGEGWYFDIIPPLANNNIEATRELRYERDWMTSIVINKDCPELERVLKMFDWCYSYEGMMVTNFGIEGETYYIDETGYPMVVDSIIEEAKKSTDPFKAAQSVLGVGTWSWTRYINEATYLQTAGSLFLEQGEEIRGYTEAGLIDYKAYTPAFDTEEREEVAEIELELGVIFNSNIDAFIRGEKSMDEWDSMVEELKDCGSERLEEIFNEAYNR